MNYLEPYTGCEPFDVLAEKPVKARTEHECTWCGLITIHKGDIYYRATLHTPDGIMTDKICMQCLIENECFEHK